MALFAREANGDNVIPQVFAAVCAMVLGASADQTIVQVKKIDHTGADAIPFIFGTGNVTINGTVNGSANAAQAEGVLDFV